MFLHKKGNSYMNIFKNNTLDMTKGKEWKLIIIFAIPIFFSSLFQTLYNIVDSIIVGKYVGDEALAAVSSSGSLIFLFNSFFIGLASGAGVVIARFFGMNDHTNMRKAIHNDVLVGLCSGLLLTIVGIFLSPIILKAMGTPDNVIEESITYFRIYFIGVSGVILYNTFSSILQALGDSFRPLIFLIISSITNVGLDFLFICGFNMGVAGASLATIISQFLSAFLAFLVLLPKKRIYHLSLKEFKFDKQILKAILYNGIPSAVQNSVIGLANVFVQSNINSFGDLVMAGCGSYTRIEGFAFLPVNCFMLSIATFVSQNLGAGEEKRAKRGSRFAIITSIIMAEAIGILVYLNAESLIGLFLSEGSKKEVLDAGVTALRTVCFFYPLLAFSHLIASCLRGAGKALIPMIIMLSIWCIFRVSYISIAMLINHNLTVLYAAYPITWGMSSAIYFVLYFFTKWYKLKKKPESEIELELNEN